MTENSHDKRTWSDAQLAVAVAACKSWRGVMRELGLCATSGGAICSVKRHVSRLGLDVSHFGSAVRWTDTQLTTALAEAASWPQLLLSLGMRPESRRSKEQVQARAMRLGLSLDHLARPSRVHTGASADPSEPSPHVTHLRDAAQSITMAWFLIRGMWPAAPTEPRPYDFLLESPSGVKRVQVKTTTCTASSGSWYVRVSRHAGGGDRHNQKLPYTADEVDVFAILDGDLMLYLIPTAAVAGRTALCLGPYGQFIVGSATSMFKGRSGGSEPQNDLRSARLPASVDALSARLIPDSRPGSGHDPAEAPQAVGREPAEHPGHWSAPAPRWTEGELRVASERATSWADLLRIFGYKPSSTKPRRALQGEVERYGIDTSHFVAQRTWSDQALRDAAKTARTWAELLTDLGLSTRNKSYGSVRAAAGRLGIDLGRLTLGPKTGREEIGIDLPTAPGLKHLRHAAPSIAAAWFMSCGRAVSVPCEPEAYDMIVDMPDGLKRVQVKSTTARDARGAWNVRIGHRPDGSPKAADLIPYSTDEVDLFFVVDGDLLLYLIPASVAAGKTTLSLRAYGELVVGDASSLMDSLDPTQDGDIYSQRTAG